MKENKKILNYFKKWEDMSSLGIGLMAVGFFLLWYARSFVSIPLIIVGIVIFIYGNLGRAPATQITDVIEDQIEKLHFKELEEDSKLRKRTPKEYNTMEFRAYRMHDGVYIKKKKDASLVSSEYFYARVAFLSDAFYVKTLTISVITEDAVAETLDIPFSSVTDIAIEREAFTVTTIDKKAFPVKECYVTISYGDGQKLRLPRVDDVYAEEFAADWKKKYVVGSDK